MNGKNVYVLIIGFMIFSVFAGQCGKSAEKNKAIHDNKHAQGSTRKTRMIKSRIVAGARGSSHLWKESVDEEGKLEIKELIDLFNGIDWDIPIREIKKSVSLALVSKDPSKNTKTYVEETGIIYTFGGVSVDVRYHFVEDIFYMGEIIPVERNRDNYSQLEDEVLTRLGNPQYSAKQEDGELKLWEFGDVRVLYEMKGETLSIKCIYLPVAERYPQSGLDGMTPDMDGEYPHRNRVK